MAKWQRPDDWPEGVGTPFFVKVGPAREGLTLVPLADGRFTLPELVYAFDPHDGNEIEIDVRIVDGEVQIRRVTVEADEDEPGLPNSTLRQYKVRDYLAAGLGQYAIGPTPGSNVELSLEPPSTATRAAAARPSAAQLARTALSVAELYPRRRGPKGVKAVADALVNDRRTSTAPRQGRRTRTPRGR